tara:strand:+ start:656 stop:1318 length:663 start_codon:yes stop_codon:yes gene_type:complete
MEPVKQKKKRGRKPKKILKTPEKEENDKIDNMVIKIKPTVNITETSSQLMDMIENHKVDYMDYGEKQTGCLCWNCCHEFSDLITGIPLKYSNNIFYTYGDFCSLECCMRYSYEYFQRDYWEILSIINLYNYKLFGNFKPIEMAPSKLTLKNFGGTLEIDEYRTKKDVHEIQLHPILPISHSNNIYEQKPNHNIENLKLYRKNKLPSDKKSITNTMNLVVS